jgi:Zn-dependent M16 (insulinase) family peptidase
MTNTHGFELLREHDLAEADSTARLYRHVRTGAELLSLINDDENKAFGITFRTPPPDSTGVAHILEHSVFCGSRKYPLKKPLIELARGSLATFLNAVTYPDKTCYPVASQNLQDFYNLIDVYLDAVFYPTLSRQTFEQEGWHYEVEERDAPFLYNGVVFNEMKGAFSSPETVLDSWSSRLLTPDTVYRHDSGGDPKRIPDLTYAGFKDFHRRYYHPSNARLFFHGDDDPAERLRLLDAWLAPFDRIAVESAIALQPRFVEPRRSQHTYVAPADDGAAAKSFVQTSWVLGDIDDEKTYPGLLILENILAGTAASPLYRALIDSRLGEAWVGSGLVIELRQPMFSAGLKGVDAANVDKVEPLILDVLGTLAAEGIDRSMIEASVNTVEFLWRENNTGSYPRGLQLMRRALGAWLYDRDPIARLAFAAPLAAIKARLAEGERYFENLIKQYLLENPHRGTVIMRPDREQAARDAAEERSRLDAARASMTVTERDALVENTRALKRHQETPDALEALASMPSLALADMPRRNKPTRLEFGRVLDTPVLYHDIATGGIVYLDLAFDLRRLPARLLPYVNLFARALLETGAGEQDVTTLSQRIGRSTGGIGLGPWTSATRTAEKYGAWLFLRGKAVADQTGELLAIIRDVLLEARLDNRDQVRSLVFEHRAGIDASLMQQGVAYAGARLWANLHEAGWAAEQISGIGWIDFTRRLADRVDGEWETVHADLERVRRILLDRARMVVSVTTDAANWRRFEPQLTQFLDGMPASADTIPIAWSTSEYPLREGLIVPTEVNAVGKGANVHRLGFRGSGAARVIARHLSTTWLWDKIRVQGGAYGVGISYDSLSGAITYLSYHDPNLLATLDVYDRTADFLRSATLTESDVTRSIIGMIGVIDQYELPDAKGYSSMVRYLVGTTEERRQQTREEVLATNVADFRNFADALAATAAHGNVAVVGSAEAIEAANRERPGFLHVSRLL